MPDTVFTSYAQTGEDVVLWRALSAVENGRYVEVGANHPTEMSATRALYEHGWSGVTIEPVDDFVAMHREQRPRDVQVQALITDAGGSTALLHEFPGTGLSTLDDAISQRHVAAGHELHDIEVPALRLDAVVAAHLPPGEPVHVLIVDTEGAEAAVLRSIDLSTWRPWVLVIEATAPLSTRPTHGEWEPAVLAAGYELCLFDGLSRFYVAAEHAPTLREALSYPACPHDVFETHTAQQNRQEREQLLADALRWRSAALEAWSARSVALATAGSADAEAARAEVEAMRRTISWRVTAPLRAVRARAPR